MNSGQIYSVGQINQYIKTLLETDGALFGVRVRGEISNYKLHMGNFYFSLKDETGSLPCVMFRGDASTLRFRPENGMKVVAFGRVSVYLRDGRYQLYVNSMTPDGVGELYVAFEQLKAKLMAQGLFDPGHKKPLPRFPGKIALVTSPTGAAIQDMLGILKARWPAAEVVVVPARVQGAEAPGEIAAGIRYADSQLDADLIITGRGGGSMEDLWAFNAEVVARAIYAAHTPVISAVGHKPDVTIADFVADLRAATPSNAAELAVPDQQEVRARLSQLSGRLFQAMSHRLAGGRMALERAGRSRVLRDPMNLLRDRRQLLDRQSERLAAGLSGRLSREKERFAGLAASLDAMSPLRVLARGYAVAMTETGAVVRSVQGVKAGETLHVKVSDGEIPCTVKEGMDHGGKKADL